MGFFTNPSKSSEEEKRLNQDLESRHYEFVSNCNDGEGDAIACHSHGEWLAVVDRNYEQAAQVYTKNCEKKKYAASCFNIGRLYLAGKGVDASDEKAFKLFETTCKAGHAQGCHHLGYMYMKGIGVKEDIIKGLDAYMKACDKEDASSCNRVGSLLLVGCESSSENTEIKKIPRDALKAKEYLKKACDANFAPACYNLAVMYKKGDESIAPDVKLHEKYRQKTNELVEQGGGLNGVKAT